MNKYEIIKKNIDEYDYYSLLKMGAPTDEFDDYSRELAEEISEDYSVEEIAVIIAEKIDRAFGNQVNPDKFISIATKIHSELQREKLKLLLYSSVRENDCAGTCS